jgi:hypothetical protein
MSNFLHFFLSKKKRQLIQLALEKVSKQGIIYVKVGNEKHGHVDFPMTQKNMNDLRNNRKIEILHEMELEDGFMEIIFKAK